MSTDRFQNKYRIPSTRLQNWDYRWNAIYFVTICTKNKIHYFGEMNDGKMNLSPVGAVADVLWLELKNHFNNIELDAFVVMPNHIHGIIVINNRDNRDNRDNRRDNACVVSTSCKSTASCTQQMPQPAQTIGQKRFQHHGSYTLSSIVGSYKSAVSRHVHRLGYEFSWQPKFYDNIVRDAVTMNKIQNYIHNNPNNWNEDKFFQL